MCFRVISEGMTFMNVCLFALRKPAKKRRKPATKFFQKAEQARKKREEIRRKYLPGFVLCLIWVGGKNGVICCRAE